MQVQLPARRASAAAARQALEVVDGVLDPGVSQTLRLLVTELVTNSIRHAGLGLLDTIELRLTAADGVLRVEVADGGGAFESKARDIGDRRIGGWGLFLVEELSDRWGVEAAAGRSTSVWFELDLDRAGA